MVEPSDDSGLPHRIRSQTRAHASSGLTPGAETHPRSLKDKYKNQERDAGQAGSASPDGGRAQDDPSHDRNTVLDSTSSASPPPAPPPKVEAGNGNQDASVEDVQKHRIFNRFYNVCKDILLSSWINVLLVFVPVGIAVEFALQHNASIVFAMNAIAIIPLAGLLSFATESVASTMGDAIGALLNVTFGNAVELIIFIILLTQNEIRIVQASLLGSILANLLLILGMCFLFGGLRFREQIYNSTVTQMSACLLSLSVMSLLLPTAFHASFNNVDIADDAVLHVSRGTSVILLLVYILYIVFQLKSHAYLYESTPQHVIDEESHPGVLADIMHSSSSSDSDSSSSSNDSDTTSGSHGTANRIKRAFRRRRKSSTSSKDMSSIPSAVVRTPSSEAGDFFPSRSPTELQGGRRLRAIASRDEAEADDESDRGRHRTKIFSGTKSRDFELEKNGSAMNSVLDSSIMSPEERPRKKTKKERRRKPRKNKNADQVVELSGKVTTNTSRSSDPIPVSGKVAFVEEPEKMEPEPTTGETVARRPFPMRSLSRPAIEKVLSQTVFSSSNRIPAAPMSTNPAPRIPYGLRRTTSLPDRLNNRSASAPPAAPPPRLINVVSEHSTGVHADTGEKKHLSRTSSILLLLVSTGLVAVCAEFMVSAIDSLVKESGISQTFIGLVILAIVGNAAEHVTAVTVASKNKMDLAIGVAIGSSIQIALFVTPIIVLLGWCLGKEMSLFFSLFETVSLFVSAFIINFLILDGRSNYLEGALLIAAYIIIAVAAFFYPNVGVSAVG